MSTVVLAISGSPRKQSFTEKMLDLVLQGMGAGLEVHKFHPYGMNIGPCNGCWSCWGRENPGECVQKDDFQAILEVYKRADYFLWAAPLYAFDFPAAVKGVLDRFFVVLEPPLRERADGLTDHPTRFDRHPQAVLISSCGFPEVENFEVLRRHFRIICEQMAWVWAGEVLIPASGIARAPKLFDGKYAQLRAAGEELLRAGISPETTAAIAAPVMPAEDYRRMATLSFTGGALAKAEMAMLALKALGKRDTMG